MIKKALSLLFFLFLFQQKIIAQCAMCKASAETSIDAGSNGISGINTGILYALFFAFLMLGSFVFMFYKVNKGLKED